ncbi:MucBP domain-containing protein [Enterococcus sp. BWB1-3]|uniref:glycosyl hydrolase family 18 protein n=1 Tax=Enterococcus sp. BWB1-3 TaxID=2787713 RepID=UPI0019225BB4|nr:glycosyl hydrolase family 18 protein [Enterococcus sp. BWB1-3]MBL1227840.1 MucBP domain-containing protein [Enterococcus sp. BWB1-3]
MVKKKSKLVSLIMMMLGIILFGVSFSSMSPDKQAYAEESQLSYRNVMYYGDWSIEDSEGNFFPKDIPAEKLTHLNFAFLDFDVEGNLEWTDEFAALGTNGGNNSVEEYAPNAGLLNALQELRLRNSNLKVGISVGGWTKSGDFALNAQNDTYRKKLVDNLLAFVEYNQMDFLDIDWEYPGSVRAPDLVDSKEDEGTPDASEADRENFVILLKELRAGLDTLGQKTGKTYELSVALAAGPYTLNKGTDIAEVFKVVDYANLMTYDIHGAWENATNHHTGLYTSSKAPQGDGKPWSFSTDDSVKFFLSNGAIPEKIVIGAAFYSRGWGNVENDGPDPVNLPGLFGSADFAVTDADGGESRGAENEKPLINGDGGRNGGIWAYRSFDQLKVKYPDLTEYWDEESKASYMYSKESKVFFTYDSIRSIQEKTNYIRENGLGGMITWMQSQDAPSSTESEKRDTLTTAIYNGLFTGIALPSRELQYLPLAVESSVIPLTDGNEGYKVTLTNNEVLKETDVVLAATEKNNKTLKNPVIILPVDGEQYSLSLAVTDAALPEKHTTQTLDLSEIGVAFVLPGETVAFNIYTNAAFAHMERISYLNVGQRIVPDGKVYNTQMVYELPEVYDKAGEITVALKDAAGQLLAEKKVYSGEVGTAFEISSPEIEGYYSETKVISGVFKYSPQEITMTYLLDNPAALIGKVRISYVTKNGEKLADDVEIVGVIGAAYQTETKAFDGYQLIETPENNSGKFTEEDQHVTYVYDKFMEESTTSEISSSATDSTTAVSTTDSTATKKPEGSYPKTGETDQMAYRILGIIGVVMGVIFIRKSRETV